MDRVDKRLTSITLLSVNQWRRNQCLHSFMEAIGKSLGERAGKDEGKVVWVCSEMEGE